MTLVNEIEAVELAVQALIEKSKQVDTQEDLIDLGTSLWRISAMTKEATEPIKARMRSAAITERQHTYGVASFKGRRGATQVQVVKPRLDFKDEASVHKYRSLVGESDFARTVKVNTTYQVHKDSLEEILSAHPNKTNILQCFKHKTQTPRVSFKQG